jgi:hypothetical protein
MVIATARTLQCCTYDHTQSVCVHCWLVIYKVRIAAHRSYRRQCRVADSHLYDLFCTTALSYTLRVMCYHQFFFAMSGIEDCNKLIINIAVQGAFEKATAHTTYYVIRDRVILSHYFCL